MTRAPGLWVPMWTAKIRFNFVTIHLRAHLVLSLEAIRSCFFQKVTIIFSACTSFGECRFWPTRSVQGSVFRDWLVAVMCRWIIPIWHVKHVAVALGFVGGPSRRSILALLIPLSSRRPSVHAVSHIKYSICIYLFCFAAMSVATRTHRIRDGTWPLYDYACGLSLICSVRVRRQDDFVQRHGGPWRRPTDRQMQSIRTDLVFGVR